MPLTTVREFPFHIEYTGTCGSCGLLWTSCVVGGRLTPLEQLTYRCSDCLAPKEPEAAPAPVALTAVATRPSDAAPVVADDRFGEYLLRGWYRAREPAPLRAVPPPPDRPQTSMDPPAGRRRAAKPKAKAKDPSPQLDLMELMRS